MKNSKIILPLALTTFLSSCYVERDVETRPPHQATVKRTTLSMNIPFRSPHSRIPAKEASQLKAYIARASKPGPVYARLVVRKLHTHFDDPMTDPRVASVTEVLTRDGIPAHRIEVLEEGNSYSSQTATQHSMWVAIDQYMAIPPKCPGFDAQIMDGKIPPEGEANFGCSNEHNFAQMLAEPKDLYKGHQSSSSDPVLNSNAIERLRSDKLKTLKIEKVDSASSGT